MKQQVEMTTVWKILGSLLGTIFLIAILYFCYRAFLNGRESNNAFRKFWNWVHTRCSPMFRKAWTSAGERFGQISRKSKASNIQSIITDDTRAAAIAQAQAQAAEEGNSKTSEALEATDREDIKSGDWRTRENATRAPLPGQRFDMAPDDLHSARRLASVKLLPEEHVKKFYESVDKYRPYVTAAMQTRLQPKLAKLSDPEREESCYSDRFQSTDSTRIGSPSTFKNSNQFWLSEASTSATVTMNTKVTAQKEPIPNSALNKKHLPDFLNKVNAGLEASSTTSVLGYGLSTDMLGAGSSTYDPELCPTHSEDLLCENIARLVKRPISTRGSIAHPWVVVSHGSHITEYPSMIAECQDQTTGK
ncbi:hypothetical protein BKA66DRAFT_570988 [Pyrenochaeta sp. MPI-SDFR-AT-0127]|nr:hypothetical protein BKA66DRAFT_570988 [Pyrenochaeta sp. MPI-SDFR-AT-0127]